VGGRVNDTAHGGARDEFQERWRERFEYYGSARDDDAGIAGWTSSGLDARLRRFRELWRRGRPGTVWLDVGCGAGTYARALAAEGVWVAGLDYSGPTIEKARWRSGPRIQFAVADVTRLPLGKGVLDGVLCFGVLQALSSPAPAIRELARALRPGGELWIDALNASCLPTRAAQLRRRMHGYPMHLRYDQPRQLIRTLTDAGFEDPRLHWVPILPGWLQPLQRVVEAGWARALLAAVPVLGSLVSHAFLVVARRRAD
jgi:ubiquinone/menaquinone biosynthesis C-methylase UbiE